MYGRSTGEYSVCSFFVHLFLFRPGEYSVCSFFVLHSFLFRSLLSMFLQICILKNVCKCKWSIENAKAINGRKSWGNLLVSFGAKDIFSSGPHKEFPKKLTLF